MENFWRCATLIIAPRYILNIISHRGLCNVHNLHIYVFMFLSPPRLFLGGKQKQTIMGLLYNVVFSRLLFVFLVNLLHTDMVLEDHFGLGRLLLLQC
jgi:hypothetical protein